MGPELDSFYKIFSDAVRNCDYYGDWRKSGKSTFLLKKNSYIVQVKLDHMKHSYDKKREFSLSVSLRIPSEIEPAYCHFGRERKSGELFYRWSIKNGCEINSSYNFWQISNSSELDIFTDELNKTLANDVPKLLDKYENLSTFLNLVCKTYSFESSLSFYYKVKGKELTLNHLRKYVAGIPDFRPREELWDWCQKRKILSKDLSKKLKNASMQIDEKYCDGFTLLSNEII